MTTELIGYTDRFSAAPGETIRFMVSTDLPGYETTLVRLIHGDVNAEGPGFKEEPVDAHINGRRSGRKQIARSGSYVLVDDHASLSRLSSFTLQAWIYPTTPGKGEAQGVLSKWSADGSGFNLAVGAEGALELWLGGPGADSGARVSTGQALRASEWYFVAAAFDAEAQTLQLHQQPLSNWPSDSSAVVIERRADVQFSANNSCPVVMAATGVGGENSGRFAGQEHYNGKIDGPRIFKRALDADEIERLRRGIPAEEVAASDLVAAWDFSVSPSTAKVIDRGPHALHGVAVNMPARAVTGHNWTSSEFDFKHAPNQYGAIYFHDDDLEDAGWEPDFEFVVPGSLRSGVYAARLTGEGQEDHIPFIVRPPRGTANAPILYLMPTMSYVAYANDRMDAAQEHLGSIPEENINWDARDLYLAEHPEFAMSFYDRHSDGSGCIYSSHLRPIVNLRPQYRHLLTTSPRLLGEDLYLIDWLDEKRFAYDVATDHDLHDEGQELLANYRVMVTGTHPEYWTTPMLTALEAYLDGGGRLMYLGGNGFYWVTSVDPERPHVAEIRRGISGSRAWNSAPGECYHSTTGELGGLWRHRGKAPNLLTGIGFTAQGWGDPAPGYTRKPGSFDKRAAFIFDGIAADETIGDFGLIFGGSAGDELDRIDYSLGSPYHTLLLATSGPHGPSIMPVIEDYLQVNVELIHDHLSTVYADMVYFETPNNGAVFSVGSIIWCGSLSHNGYDNNVSRITENVLTAFANSTELAPSSRS
jgi:N,N-dimethylformamidase